MVNNNNNNTKCYFVFEILIHKNKFNVCQRPNLFEPFLTYYLTWRRPMEPQMSKYYLEDDTSILMKAKMYCTLTHAQTHTHTLSNTHTHT